ncbi:MAG: bifunctional oligoribonuclease/PAP phosphatase NrnA [Flavobacteriaceae bacterium]|nr:bifunctional oligoribonuclease/PAP phosphatase NrnA [Flavobacteriaceae bacterium]
MNPHEVNTVRALLSEPQQAVIIPHKNPDGDAIGSCLGLYHFLRKLGHDAKVVAPNDYPKFLKWMPGNNDVIIFDKQTELAQGLLDKAALVFTLDFNDLGRVGPHMETALKQLKVPMVMIDHHQAPSDYAKVTYSDTGMSSTCEMVYRFIEAVGSTEIIDADIANCLYAGIVTDTGSFKFPSTSSDTHRIAADLIDKGAQNSDIHSNIFDTNTPARLHLLGCALKNMVIKAEVSTAYITLSQAELDQYQYKKGDTEGFVNYGLTLEGIKFAVIFIENKEEGIIKISFRSTGEFSVNDFARTYFNGGGHKNAAGGRSERSMEDTVAYFESLLEKHKKDLNP